jgi:cytochrome P450 family 135
MAEIAHAELDTWTPGKAIRTLPRMQALTLEVMLRVVFGSRDDALRDALRAPLDMTQSTPRLIAMSLVQRDVPGTPFRRFVRAVRHMDAVLAERLRTPAPGSVLALLAESGASPQELRDQVVTLLAAGHETTATALAWAVERLVRHPDKLDRLRAEAESGEDEYVDAVAKETLRLRPVLPIVVRRLTEPMEIGGRVLPAGVSVAPCIHLVHRRPDVYPEPRRFRPERFLEEPAGTYTWIPFGGGVRRCLGGSFAVFEMKAVLSELAASRRLRAVTAAPERVARRAITLTPSRGAEVTVEAFESSPREPAAVPAEVVA